MLQVFLGNYYGHGDYSMIHSFGTSDGFVNFALHIHLFYHSFLSCHLSFEFQEQERKLLKEIVYVPTIPAYPYMYFVGRKLRRKKPSYN
jgi:hypothetical protein